MERKLAAYRAEQSRSEKFKNYQNKVKSVFSSLLHRKRKQSEDDLTEENEKDQNRPAENLSELPCLNRRRNMEKTEETQDLLSDDVISINSEDLTDDSLMCCTWLQLLYYFLYFVLWATVYMVFIELQFGTVYLISSALIFMYLNTSTEPKKIGEVSAYSVFNKNCESIDGTLKAEQFERELIYGPGAVR